MRKKEVIGKKEIMKFALAACVIFLSVFSFVNAKKTVNTSYKAGLADIVVFGDSLSDSGNFFGILNDFPYLKNIRMTSPPSSYGGHAITNGSLVVEYLANHYKINLRPAWATEDKDNSTLNRKDGIITREADKVAIRSLFTSAYRGEGDQTKMLDYINEFHNYKARTKPVGHNYAFINATILPDYNINLMVNELFNKLSLSHQIDDYKKYGNKNDIENTLFVIWIGGNDISRITIDPRSTVEQKMKVIPKLVLKINESIKRLQKMGAKKLLVAGIPDIGLTPAFFGTKAQPLSSTLAQVFEEHLGKSILSNYSQEQVAWVPILEFFRAELQNWPEKNTRYQACVSHIASTPFDITRFTEQEELKIRFINNCTQEDLDQGRRFFYDHFHGTDAIYQKTSTQFIEATEQLFNN